MGCADHLHSRANLRPATSSRRARRRSAGHTPSLRPWRLSKGALSAHLDGTLKSSATRRVLPSLGTLLTRPGRRLSYATGRSCAAISFWDNIIV